MGRVTQNTVRNNLIDIYPWTLQGLNPALSNDMIRLVEEVNTYIILNQGNVADVENRIDLTEAQDKDYNTYSFQTGDFTMDNAFHDLSVAEFVGYAPRPIALLFYGSNAGGSDVTVLIKRADEVNGTNYDDMVVPAGGTNRKTLWTFCSAAKKIRYKVTGSLSVLFCTVRMEL